MKKSVGAKLLTGVLAASFLLTACGSNKDSYYAESPAATEAAYDSNGVYEYKTADFATEESAELTGNTQAEQVVDTSRKLITTMNISAEAENLDEVLGSVDSKIKELGGYVESSNIYNGSRYSGRVITRTADLTIRIPAAKLDLFLETVEGVTNITNKSKNVEDVTLQYVDIESKKKALKAEETRLLEIVESAETVEDIITVESRLSDVRYEIESIESQLRTYDNKVNYSTVYLDVTEVTKYTPVEEKSAGKRMVEGFLESCSDVLHAIAELFIWFVIHIPQLVIFAAFVTVIVLIIRKISKKKKKG
ncbi:DUF4349 domain-containing protein [Butyrivibrio sp. VCB2006]|uniref:DUF4349 domain-containing protein n=1 Tax=Butyrivibrio sp. VCB2006 TaxID=1280679 RepID=UPI0003F5FE5E|nr:DUF4349 domain-containing protein [Butyrivibrio sp. VCB2006]